MSGAGEGESPPSVEAAQTAAEATVVAATAEAAAHAQAAAAHVTEHATHIAAVATEVAAERVGEIEQRVDESLNSQGNALADFMARTEEWQTNLTSRLEAAETATQAALSNQAETAEQLRLIAERLIPPASQEAPPAVPETEAERQSAAEAARPVPEPSPRRRHRVV